jgi:phosphatidylinositol glycan class T
MLPEQALNVTTHLTQPPLYAERSFTGYGQERGGVQALLTNPSPSHSVEFVYLESLPWFLKPYIHTLKAEVTTPSTITDTSDESVIKEMYYRPALDRRRGTQLEILLRVPPNSTTTLSYSFEKAILRYTEYPPDANRGFDIGSAVIRLISPLSDSNEPTYLRTTSLLLPLPTPDFSMPYNVIILTSTVMALGFGSIFTLLVRRFVGADEVETLNAKNIKDRIRGRVMLLKGRIFRKQAKTE